MGRALFFNWPDVPDCKGCIYYRPLCNRVHVTAGRACHYCLDNGRMRGCPPGKNCTQKRTEGGTTR